MRPWAVNIKYFKIIRRPGMTCPNGYLIYCIPPQIYTHGSFNSCFWSKVETVATAGRGTVVLGMGMRLGIPFCCWLPWEKPPGAQCKSRNIVPIIFPWNFSNLWLPDNHVLQLQQIGCILVLCTGTRNGDCSGALLHGASAQTYSSWQDCKV